MFKKGAIIMTNKIGCCYSPDHHVVLVDPQQHIEQLNSTSNPGQRFNFTELDSYLQKRIEMLTKSLPVRADVQGVFRAAFGFQAVPQSDDPLIQQIKASLDVSYGDFFEMKSRIAEIFLGKEGMEHAIFDVESMRGMLQVNEQVLSSKEVITRWLAHWPDQEQKNRHGFLMDLTDCFFYPMLKLYANTARNMEQSFTRRIQQIQEQGGNDPVTAGLDVSSQFQSLASFTKNLIYVCGDWRPIIAAWIIESDKINSEFYVSLLREHPDYIQSAIACNSELYHVNGTPRTEQGFDFGSKVLEKLLQQ